MTIAHKIWEFPTFPISKQVFYVPGAGAQGGFTAGGAQIITPEPGGFSRLEIEPAFRDEWEFPISSWLMSKANGQILRVRLAPTPQVAWSKRRMGASVLWDTGILWSNQQAWDGDFSVSFSAVALEGTSEVKVDFAGIGPIAQIGRVIGHANSTYKIDEISYAGNIATITLNPPLRVDVAVNDPAYLRPWFLGRVANAQEVIATYDAENNGFHQPGKIILNEAII